MSKVDLIIFGATGDLSARKLFPALFHLDAAGLLPEDLRIAAVARQAQEAAVFREELRLKMNSYLRGDVNDSVWHHFAARIDYIAADFSQPEAFEGLRCWLDDSRVSLFYLATPPSLSPSSVST